MITCNLMGGLGNQLFQIFTTIAYAIRSKNAFMFANIEKMGGGECTLRYTYWNTLLSKLKPFLKNKEEFPNLNIIKEERFHYTPIDSSLICKKDVCLCGYYQSYKYFQEYFNTICKIIQLEDMKQKILQKFNYNSNFLDNSISLHFRFGDYKKLQYCHPLMNYFYYEDALQYIKDTTIELTDKNILYFCEEEDIEQVEQIIHNLKAKFNNFHFTRVSNDLEDWQQMLLMSCCHYNVIGNSSFSWWGAYFNNNPTKIVCYPSIWFGPTISHDTKDLCPTEWIKISVK